MEHPRLLIANRVLFVSKIKKIGMNSKVNKSHHTADIEACLHSWWYELSVLSWKVFFLFCNCDWYLFRFEKKDNHRDGESGEMDFHVWFFFIFCEREKLMNEKRRNNKFIINGNCTIPIWLGMNQCRKRNFQQVSKSSESWNSL